MITACLAAGTVAAGKILLTKAVSAAGTVALSAVLIATEILIRKKMNG